jgi:hypothetical protein
MNGIGFGARHTALLGMVPVSVNPPSVLPSYGAVPMVSKERAGKSQTRRNNEALLLMLLK